MLETDSHTSPEPLISVRDLCLQRGGRALVRDLEFQVSQGDALILTGPNGSGKTTLLRAIAGLVRPESGQVILADSAREPALLGHALGLKPGESVQEHIEFSAKFFEGNISDYDEIKARLQIGHLWRLPCGRLSAGQKQRVALARVALSGKALWLLDEPAAPLDDKGRRLLADLVRHHRDQGGAVIAATHRDLDWAEADHMELTV